jgi:hypothetical protein
VTTPTRRSVERVPTTAQLRARLGVPLPEEVLDDLRATVAADTRARVRAEARHNRARVEAALAGRPVPGPLTSRPAVPSRPQAPGTAPEDRVREILAGGDWITHNAIGDDNAERRALSSALFALVDSGEVEAQRIRATADGSRRRYRIARA